MIIELQDGKRIETYNIGDIIHRVYTSPADAEMNQYRDEHYYMGPGRITSISITVGAFGEGEHVSVCYQFTTKTTGGDKHTNPVYAEDAFATKEDAEAEVKRRENAIWNPEEE